GGGVEENSGSSGISARRAGSIRMGICMLRWFIGHGSAAVSAAPQNRQRKARVGLTIGIPPRLRPTRFPPKDTPPHTPDPVRGPCATVVSAVGEISAAGAGRLKEFGGGSRMTQVRLPT